MAARRTGSIARDDSPFESGIAVLEPEHGGRRRVLRGAPPMHARTITFVREVNRRMVAMTQSRRIARRVKVVKQQINGGDRVVLKENAMAEDLKAEAMRLKRQLGYDIQHDKRRGTYILSHDFFRGKFVVMLAPD